LFPLVVLLELVSKLMQRGTRRVGTEEQIRSLVRLGSASGYIAKEEDTIIHRVFVLNDRTAGEMMTPLEETAVLDAAVPIRDAVAFVREKRFSRYPVVEGAGGSGVRAGEIVGTVLAADIFERALFAGRGGTVGDIMTPPILVDAVDTADAVMLRFKRERKHMAVVHQDGIPAGILTFEDILEELVGEIEDERD
jgi:putative hemolysin